LLFERCAFLLLVVVASLKQSVGEIDGNSVNLGYDDLFLSCNGLFALANNLVDLSPVFAARFYQGLAVEEEKGGVRGVSREGLHSYIKGSLEVSSLYLSLCFLYCLCRHMYYCNISF